MISPPMAGSSFRNAAKWNAPWLIVLVSSLTACSSERITSLDGLDLFLRFRVDGALVEYTSLGDAFGLYSHVCDVHYLNVAAWDSNSGFGLKMSTEAGSPGPGTWSIVQRASDPTFHLSLYYEDPGGVGHLARPVVPEDATVTISQVGSATISGTFFGLVKAPDVPDIAITDGEFMVRREHDKSWCP